jgi:hypothetical protein
MFRDVRCIGLNVREFCEEERPKAGKLMVLPAAAGSVLKFCFDTLNSLEPAIEVLVESIGVILGDEAF